MIQADAAAMGKAWPNITLLSLCGDPLHSAEGEGVALEDLGAFLENLPKLQVLGVYVVSTVVGSAKQEFRDQRNSTTLNFGTSPAFPRAHLLQLQAYLSRICPDDAKIVATRTRGSVELVRTSAADLKAYTDRSEFWDSVGASVKMILEEKAQLVKENSMLKKANADLLCQLGELQGYASESSASLK